MFIMVFCALLGGLIGYGIGPNIPQGLLVALTVGIPPLFLALAATLRPNGTIMWDVVFSAIAFTAAMLFEIIPNNPGFSARVF